MAQMFPSEIPADVSATKSERALFKALRHGLPEDYFVYCALPFIAAEFAEQGEVDFIILHPLYGMLFLECKGGGVERAHDGTWYRRKGKKRERMTRSPAEQAKKQVEALVTKFRKPCGRLFGRVEGRFPMPYGWALAFPFTNWSADEIPPDVEPAIFLDAEILGRTQAKIDGAFAFWHQGNASGSRLTPEQFEVFRHAILSPEFRLVPNLGGLLQAERNEVVRLNQQQSSIADRFATERRIMIDGGSGTGKTLLALHAAQRMANEEKRVLLLCASAEQAAQLRQTTDVLARQIQIATAETTTLNRADFPPTTTAFERPDFDAPTLPLRLADIEAATRAIALSEASESTTRFDRPDFVPSFHVKQVAGTIQTYDLDGLCIHAAQVLRLTMEPTPGPRVLMAALEAQLLGPWDAIIVDQGQELAAAAWEVLESSLAPGGVFAVFYDSSTNLPIPRLGPITVLKRPDAVDTVSQAIRGIALPTEPIVYLETQRDDAEDRLFELVSNLVKVHGVKYEQLAILTANSGSSLTGRSEVRGVPIIGRDELRQRGVLHVTVSEFEEMQSDIIILMLPPSHFRTSPAYARYFAKDRPCLRIFVIVDELSQLQVPRSSRPPQT